MNARPGFVLAFVVVALSAWLAIQTGGSLAPAPRPVPAAEGAASPLDPMVRAVQSQAGRLRAYLADVPPLTRPTRNPFRFRQPAADASVRRPAPALSTPSAVLAPSRPVLTLSGLAEDTSPGGAVRTAVITAGGQLYLVKEGETFARRFRVDRIGADTVRVSDLDDQTTFTLMLKR